MDKWLQTLSRAAAVGGSYVHVVRVRQNSEAALKLGTRSEAALRFGIRRRIPNSQLAFPNERKWSHTVGRRGTPTLGGELLPTHTSRVEKLLDLDAGGRLVICVGAQSRVGWPERKGGAGERVPCWMTGVTVP